MTRRIVIVQGHPDPDPARLCRALADAYAEGAQAAGHVVSRIDLASLEIDFLRTQQAFEHGEMPEALVPARDAIRNADHLVLVFPLWLGTAPALVKAFLEHVMRPGVAFAYREGRLPEKLLAGRSVRLVVTMAMPAMAYRLWFGAHGLRSLEQGVFRFVGMRPVRRTLFGMVAAAGAARRADWLANMRRLGSAGV